MANTSHSEGIPLVLMEAMAHGKLVLTPAITGIPELVIDGQTGFLYRPGVLEDFVGQVERIVRDHKGLAAIQSAARNHVMTHFNRRDNLEHFANEFLEQIETGARRGCLEPGITPGVRETRKNGAPVCARKC